MKSMAIGTRHDRRVAKPAAKVIEQLAFLEEAIGGRDALVAAIAHAPKSREISYLLGQLGDPAEATVSLAELCARGGITPGELVDAYKAGELHRAQAVASHQVGKKLGLVAEDTMRMALPREMICAVCEGNGTLVPEPTKKHPNPNPEKCRTCAGTGKLVVEGDVEHKKLALDMGKMLQKGGGMSINMHQQVAVLAGTSGGALEKLQEATDRVLYGDGASGPLDVVEAEVAESQPEIEAGEATLDEDWRGEAQP